MHSAFGIDHGDQITKMAPRAGGFARQQKYGMDPMKAVKRPKGRLRQLKAEAVNRSTRMGTPGRPSSVLTRAAMTARGLAY